MTAELVDPFATPIRAVWSKGALDEMESQLRYSMSQRDDSDLFPDIARKVVHDLHEAATAEGHPAGLFAGRLLEQLWHRGESGVPYSWRGEPAEPSWSLDPEPHHRPDERPEDDPWIPTCDGRNCGGRPHE